MPGNNGEMYITKETWLSMSPENRDWIIYSTIIDQGRRIKILEGRGLYHKACAVVGGFVGGFVAYFGGKYVNN